MRPSDPLIYARFSDRYFFLQIHLVKSFDILHGCDDDDMTGKENNFKIQEDLTITIRIWEQGQSWPIQFTVE